MDLLCQSGHRMGKKSLCIKHIHFNNSQQFIKKTFIFLFTEGRRLRVRAYTITVY